MSTVIEGAASPNRKGWNQSIERAMFSLCMHYIQPAPARCWGVLCGGGVVPQGALPGWCERVDDALRN